MKALYKLQAKAWIANPFVKSEFITSVLFLVVISSITMMSLPNGAPDEMIAKANITIIASIVALFTMQSAIYSFGFAFYEMKESVLLKRIGATKISKGGAIVSFVLWGLTSTFIMWAWLALIVGIATAVGPDVSGILWVGGDTLANVDWVGFFGGLILTSIAFLPIAFLFVSVAPNSEIYNSVATIYFMLIGFLGGSMTPTVTRDWMNVISLLSPLGWTTSLITNSAIGQVNWTEPSQIAGSLPGSYSTGDWTSIGLVEVAFPLMYGGLAGIASAKLFKWD